MLRVIVVWVLYAALVACSSTPNSVHATLTDSVAIDNASGTPIKKLGIYFGIKPGADVHGFIMGLNTALIAELEGHGVEVVEIESLENSDNWNDIRYFLFITQLKTSTDYAGPMVHRYSSSVIVGLIAAAKNGSFTELYQSTQMINAGKQAFGADGQFSFTFVKPAENIVGKLVKLGWIH